MPTSERIGPVEFERAVGLSAGTLDARTRQLLEESPMDFVRLTAGEQEVVQQEIRNQIAAGFTKVGEHRADVWRDAWQDQLDEFVRSGYRLESLNPRFVGDTSILRWQGEYVRAETPRLELIFFSIFRDWLFRTFLNDVDRMYEFGSGSAFNVAAYAKLFPKAAITALDWAPAAVTLANLLRTHHGMNVRGDRFDFFAPASSLPLGPESGVLTMCALEQVGDRFGPFLEYLVSNRPRRVVHVEPILELYDPALVHDSLAIGYHSTRSYLSGLLPRLKELASNGEIHLGKVQRLRFGSRFHECFTIVEWETR